MSKSLGINHQTLEAFRIYPLVNGHRLAVATGFFYDWQGSRFLVTNWHNVTGRRPVEHTVISKLTASPPTQIEVIITRKVHIPGGDTFHLESGSMIVDLYSDADRKKSNWLEHPTHRDAVDVVALKINNAYGEETQTGTKTIPAISRGRSNLMILVGMNVSILGYPKGIGAGSLPIWKRGSIASEPSITLDELPRFYVDSATRQGMSGAPVILHADSPPIMDTAGIRLEPGERPYRFIGVYSGRVGAKDLGAQLGVVWTEPALQEIIERGLLTDVSRWEKSKPRDPAPLVARNWNLLRGILISMADSSLDQYLPLCSEEFYEEHVRLLFEGKLVEPDPDEPDSLTVSRLTWKGHDLLAMIRDEAVWKEISERVAQRGPDSASYDLIFAYAMEIRKR